MTMEAAGGRFSGRRGLFGSAPRSTQEPVDSDRPPGTATGGKRDKNVRKLLLTRRSDRRQDYLPSTASVSIVTRDSDSPADDTDQGESPSADELYEQMELPEPYTTSELAGLLGVPRRLARSLPEALSDGHRIRKKQPEKDRVIWIREPPVHAYPNCGREFEIKYLHTVLSAVRFCPRCGTRLE